MPKIITFFWYCPYTLLLLEGMDNIRTVRVKRHKEAAGNSLGKFRLCKTLSALYSLLEKNTAEAVFLLSNCCDVSRHADTLLRERFPAASIFTLPIPAKQDCNYEGIIDQDKKRLQCLLATVKEQHAAESGKPIEPGDVSAAEECCPFLTEFMAGEELLPLKEIKHILFTMGACLCGARLPDDKIAKSIRDNAPGWQDENCLARNYLMLLERMK